MGLDAEEIFGSAVVMAILRNLTPSQTVQMADRAWSLGIDVVEVPVQTPDALPSLRAAVSAARERDRRLGAGTVTTVEQVRAVAEIGAAFTVAPGFDPAVLAASHGAGMPHLPGVATPSEVQLALTHGVSWVKVFPASVLGPGWFTAIRAPFPELRMVGTGGIDAGTALEYLAAGARVVAVGSALADAGQLARLAEIVASKGRPGHPRNG